MVILSSREAEDEICAGVGPSLLVYTVLHPRQGMEPLTLSGSSHYDDRKTPVSHMIVDLSR